MSRRRFKTVISRARFTVSPYTPRQMVELGKVVRDSVRVRILRAVDVSDQPAPPLKKKVKGRGYPEWKARVRPPAIRNWRLTGRTMGAMRVLSANQNRVVIGFSDAVANLRAWYNNRRHRQFGMSPSDWRAALASVRKLHAVKAEEIQ